MILSVYFIYLYILCESAYHLFLKYVWKCRNERGCMVTINKTWWFSQRKTFLTVTVSHAGAIRCLNFRYFHLTVLLWAMRQGEINRTQKAENCSINPVREFTFLLSDNINHLNICWNGFTFSWAEMEFTSQVFFLNQEEDIKWVSEAFIHILVALSVCLQQKSQQSISWRAGTQLSTEVTLAAL